jgi:hypothetical protein
MAVDKLVYNNCLLIQSSRVQILPLVEPGENGVENGLKIKRKAHNYNPQGFS